jgi:hypothetical protein
MSEYIIPIEHQKIKIGAQELPSPDDVILALRKANLLLCRLIGGLYIQNSISLMDEDENEVQHAQLQRIKLARAQHMLIGVIKDCQFHNMECECDHCVEGDED